MPVPRLMMKYLSFGFMMVYSVPDEGEVIPPPGAAGEPVGVPGSIGPRRAWQGETEPMRLRTKWDRRDRKRRRRQQLDMVVKGRSTRDVLAPLAAKGPPKRRKGKRRGR